MARTYVRSFRLEEDLQPLIELMPKGTPNTLVNELLAYYFAHPELQELIPIKDERFPDDEPVTLGDSIDKPPKAAKKKPKVAVVEAVDEIEEAVIIEAPAEPAPQLNEKFEYVGDTTEPVEPEPVKKSVESVDKPDPKSFLPGF